MANTLEDLEKRLNDFFIKKVPALPETGKKFIVNWAPVLSIVIGIITLLSAWMLWNWAHTADSILGSIHTACDVYNVSGCPNVSHLSLWVWLGFIFLLLEGLLYLLAYPGLRDRTKQGWNYLFYGSLINVGYAILSLFTDYDKVGHFIGGVIGTAIGFYFLFQIREYYLGKKNRVAPIETTPTDKTNN